MTKKGISIYPEHSTVAQDKAYLSLAASYGFSRVFTCLLSVTESVETIKETFRETNRFAHELGFEIIFDVAPSVFSQLGISYDDLSFFKELYADGIRLDEGFDGHKEAQLTFNPEGLEIEINASQPTKYLDNILSYHPFKDKLIACHNFYPQRYSGLGYELFRKTSKAMKDHNLRVAAFVSSQNSNTFGPWPIDDGLCTLEIHRHCPIDFQVRHLYATNLIDDVIIANAFASEDELRQVSEIHPGKLMFRIMPFSYVSDVEREIIFNYPHFVRGDMSDYMARSTMPRIAFKEADIPQTSTPDLKRGDIVVLNNQYGRYKGELHIVLQDMENDGRKNLVAQLSEQEQLLLEFIEPWKSFTFME